MQKAGHWSWSPCKLATKNSLENIWTSPSSFEYSQISRYSAVYRQSQSDMYTHNSFTGRGKSGVRGGELTSTNYVHLAALCLWHSLLLLSKSLFQVVISKWFVGSRARVILRAAVVRQQRNIWKSTAWEITPPSVEKFLRKIHDEPETAFALQPFLIFEMS